MNHALITASNRAWTSNRSLMTGQLAAIDSWSTEEFETPNPIEAKGLLNEVS